MLLEQQFPLMADSIWCNMAKDRVILERRFVPKGTVVIRESDEAYSAYLIQSGEVVVYTKSDGQEVELARLGVGEICGEMSLIGDNRRSASVRTTEDCNLIVITRSAFEEKLRNSDPTIQAIVQMLIKRIITSNEEIIGKTSKN